MLPLRLIVPHVQRPNVWNEENQWAPLWRALGRATERLLAEPQLTDLPQTRGMTRARTAVPAARVGSRRWDGQKGQRPCRVDLVAERWLGDGSPDGVDQTSTDIDEEIADHDDEDDR